MNKEILFLEQCITISLVHVEEPRLVNICGIRLQKLCVSSCLNNRCFWKMKGSDRNKDVLGCSFESVIPHNFLFCTKVHLKTICNTLRWGEINFVFLSIRGLEAERFTSWLSKWLIWMFEDFILHVASPWLPKWSTFICYPCL